MPIDAGTMARLRVEASRADYEDLAPLTTRAELIAFMIATARAEGRAEFADVELMLTAASMSREDLRQDARTLRRLGYTAAADLMQVMAKTAKPKALTSYQSKCRRHFGRDWRRKVWPSLRS
jgi:hypothetical protein